MQDTPFSDLFQNIFFLSDFFFTIQTYDSRISLDETEYNGLNSFLNIIFTVAAHLRYCQKNRQNNCQKNSFEPQFGLKVYGTCRSSIYLVHPLTKEIVSKNNNCHGNWGCHYTKAVLNKNIEEHIKTIKELNGKDHSEEKDQ